MCYFRKGIESTGHQAKVSFSVQILNDDSQDNFCASVNCFLFYTGFQLIYHAVLFSGIQQSDSIIHTHIFTLCQILFPFRLLLNTEELSLFSTVYPCWLPILNAVAGICRSQTPSLTLPPGFRLW